MIRHYLQLTKPGIVFGNLILAVSGYLVAEQSLISGSCLVALLGGLSLVIASACVCNNAIDRESDAKMQRTQCRALAAKVISLSAALFYALGLVFSGLLLLAVCCGFLAALLAFAGFVVYVALYSFLKHHSAYATQVGSLAGAMPPVVGYVAAGHSLDGMALTLFGMLVLWQMPHFYAIAIYRLDDYAAASIPVLPIKRGVPLTKRHMMGYVVAFILVALLPLLFADVGYGYLAAVLLLGLSWIWLGVKGFSSADDVAWARTMFRHSIMTITLLAILMTV